MTTPPFVIHVAALRRNPGTRLHERRSGHIGGLTVSGSSVPPDAEVTVDAGLELAGNSIVVTGTVTANWVGECRRCLGPVTGDLAVPVRELYERRAQRPHGLEGEETYPLDGDSLDLLPLARDAVLLDLPLAPLCRPDCAGLCPTCGADLNAGPCGCPSEDVNGRWAALDALRSPDSA